MKVQVRMSLPLYDQVRSDLMRPHSFAHERVGFLFARFGSTGADKPIVLLTRYSAVADDRYIKDPSVGARIDSQAIREAMQDVLDQGDGVFHVHVHPWPGEARFSPLDYDELPLLVPGFQAVGPTLIHGLFLIGDEDCRCEVWLPGNKEAVIAESVTIVGYPMTLMTRGRWHYE